jgi:hypothetical protein
VYSWQGTEPYCDDETTPSYWESPDALNGSYASEYAVTSEGCDQGRSVACAIRYERRAISRRATTRDRSCAIAASDAIAAGSAIAGGSGAHRKQ